MGEILQNWLATRLGIILDMKPGILGTHMQDGVLFAKLLHSYNVIDAALLKEITPTQDAEMQLKNMMKLKIWFHYIGIKCDDSVFKDIAEGKGDTAKKLIYHMFLCLENKDKIHFISQTYQRGAASDMRFEVKKVLESVFSESRSNEEMDSKKLQEDEYLSQFFSKKYQEILNKCTLYRVDSRREVESEVERIFREGMEGKPTFSRKASQDVELTLREGSEERKSASSLEEEKSSLSSSESSSKERIIPDGFIKFTPMQKVDKKAEQVYAERINKLILSELWHKIMKLQEKQVDNVIAKKLVKQSQYEKQIATKLMLIRNEKKIMAENRQVVEKLILEKREEEYNYAIALCSELEKGRGGRQFEKERTLELHERIESAKKKSDYEKNCLMSKDIMEAIADIAIKISDYKKANEDFIPPKVISEWKALFFKSQPIYETIDVEEIISQETLTDEDEAAKVEAEIERQNVINDHNLQEYLDLEGPWDLEQLCPDLQHTEGSQMVLGYIVHRLLELKYPYPPPPVPADLPGVSVAAVLLGASDPKVVACLKELLTKRAIQIISMENVISECVETYKQESHAATAEESSPVDEVHVKKGEKHPHSKGGAKSKKMSVDKKKMSLKEGLEEEETINKDNKDEQTQTPAVIPEQEEPPLSLSPKAELGKRALEYLSEGKVIDDNDLIDMIIVYLKEQKDMDGWVILDYPSTYEQSRIFEEKISGKEMPVVEEKGDKMEIVKFEDRSLESKLAAELERKKRTSRLVPNPIKRPEKEPFATCLTAYINARKKDMEYFSKLDDDFEICDDDTSPLDYVYADQGVNYSFYYKSMDFPTIKRLARIIIGDMELPPKPSTELFGDTFEDIERNLFPETRKKPSTSKKKVVHKPKSASHAETPSEAAATEAAEIVEPTISPEESVEDKKKHKGGKQKGKKGDSISGSTKTEAGKKGKPDLQEQEDEKKEEAIEDDETEAKSRGSKKRKQSEDKDILPEVPKYKPGEEGWEYVSLGLQEGMDIALAELWENVEEVYTKDFKEIFFLKRIQESIVIPYVNFVKDSIKKFISRPDNKQEIVTDFQIQYNGMDEDLRQDVEVKNELHCRVSELRNVLWDICDSRKVEAENERKRIISELWLMYEMTCLVNLYVASVQLEIDRCADTLQILNDYYISMLNKVPPPVRLEKCLLPRLELGDRESLDTGEVLEGKTDLKPEGRTAKRLKSDAGGSTRPAAIREAVTKLLTAEQDTTLLLPFNTFINDTNRMATSQVEGYNANSRDVISKEDDSAGAKKSVGRAKRASSKGKKSVSVALLPSETKDLLEPRKLLIEEWTAAAQGEIARALFRLQILKARIVADLTELQNKVQEIFYRMHKAIGIRYEHEVESVDRLCCLLCNAIEEEVRIQPELVLDGERFYVRSDVFMYPEPPPPEPPPLAERITPTEFRVQQLQLLFSKFSRMGPQGLLPERAFVFTLQDLLLCNIELGDVKPLPKSWNELFSGDVQVLVEQIFGKSEFVDWKDFLIHGLDLPYPTQIDILHTRDQFLLYDLDHKETVSEDEYMRVKFWYERDLPDDPQYGLRIQMAKEFLFKLFQVPHMLLINYSALLLAFCKDDDPIEGFCKALALVTGKRVPYPIEEQESKEEMQDGALSEADLERRKEAENVADVMIDHVVEDTIQSVMGITIREVDDEGQEIKPKFSERAVKVTSFEAPSTESSTNRLIAPPTTPEWSETHISPYMYEVLQTVTFVLVLSILTTKLPWHARFPPFMVTNMKSLHEALLNVFEGEDCIPVKQFLEHPFLTTLTSEVYCFKKCSIADLVEKIVASKLDTIKPIIR